MVGEGMRVRLRFSPKQYWVVESKYWYGFNWQYEDLFWGDNAYERAKDFALKLKNPQIEEIT
jgi:hypothetical protein